MNQPSKSHRHFWVSAVVLIAFAAAGIAIRFSRPRDESSGKDDQIRKLSEEPIESPPIQRATSPIVTLKSGATLQSSSPIASDYAALDPIRDGWTTESLHDAIKSQLKRLGKLLASPDDLDDIHVSQILSPRFVGESLRPQSLEAVYESNAFRIQRPVANANDSRDVFRGIEGGLTNLRRWLEPVKHMRVRRLDTKIIRVTVNDQLATCRILSAYSGHGPSESIQQTATWTCQWELKDALAPRLVELSVADYEQATAHHKQGPLFVDATSTIFGADDCFDAQIRPGIDYWTSKLTQNLGMYLDGWNGVAVGDVNGDGLDDLYVCQPGGLPNRLFLHQTDNTAVDVAEEWGVDWLDRSSGALLVDLDNDGRQDLVLAVQGGIMILRNQESGQFRFRQSIATDGQPYSLAAADFDQNGLLDIYVCCYNRGVRSAQQGGLDVPVPYYDANNGAANALLANNGDFVLRDVTAKIGMDVNNRRFSYAAAWEDFDNDGDQDLYVANDFGRNNLYRNDQGQFTDVAHELGVEDVGSGMSVSWSDYNGDGRMDLYVGNMFSAAGSRISYQRKFSSAFPGEVLASVRRLAQGNTLFRNSQDGTMHDVSVEAGVDMGRWSWSSKFLDINNDGREDLVVANGFVTGTTDVDL